MIANFTARYKRLSRSYTKLTLIYRDALLTAASYTKGCTVSHHPFMSQWHLPNSHLDPSLKEEFTEPDNNNIKEFLHKDNNVKEFGCRDKSEGGDLGRTWFHNLQVETHDFGIEIERTLFQSSLRKVLWILHNEIDARTIIVLLHLIKI